MSTEGYLDPAVYFNLIQGATLDITSSRYITVAGLTVALYDIFLLLADEVKLVWGCGSKTSIRMLYFFNRYVPPMLLIVANYQISPFRPSLSTSFCRGWISFALCFQVMSGMCSSYILLLRVITLYGDKRIINTIIYTLYFISYGICITAAVICIVNTRQNMRYYSELGGICNFSGNQIWFIIVMTSPILFELSAGILTLRKAFKHAHALWSSALFPLLHSLLRDDIFYCIIIIALRVCKTFIWTMLPSGSVYLGLYMLWAPISVMSTRFYLNIRSVATIEFSPSYSVSITNIRSEGRNSATIARVPEPPSTPQTVSCCPVGVVEGRIS